MQIWARSIGDLFFPRFCPVCGARLSITENDICLSCRTHLPETDYHRWRGNPLEQLFWGKVPVERAVAFFYFFPNSPYRGLLHAIKYQGRRQIAESLAFRYGLILKRAALFDTATAVIPVPLHPQRLRLRGYNQSEAIACGIGRALDLPVHTDLLVRERDNTSQTGKSRFERWRNAQALFRARRERIPAQSHLLLTDDVITTGATLTACCEAILRVAPDCRISIVALAVTAES